MICQACRDDVHVNCADMDRAIAVMQGNIPGATPTAGQWCDCQHEAR